METEKDVRIREVPCIPVRLSGAAAKASVTRDAPSMNSKFFLPTLVTVAATTWIASAQNAPSPKEDRRLEAATTGEDIGISARDGITVSGADVMVTRNGRTEKLEAPLKLDGGTIINPDGTVKLSDGRKITLRAEQRLTFDGRLLESPVQPNPPEWKLVRRSSIRRLPELAV